MTADLKPEIFKSLEAKYKEVPVEENQQELLRRLKKIKGKEMSGGMEIRDVIVLHGQGDQLSNAAEEKSKIDVTT